MNIATILVGLGVVVFLAVAAYFTYRSYKKGGCAECVNRDKCDKER